MTRTSFDVRYVPKADIVGMISAPRVVAFRQGLAEMGRGQNVTIKYRGADLFPELALFG